VTLPELQLKQPSKRDDDGWIENLCGALTDPIIVYPSPWQEDIPEDLKKQIPLERMIMNIKVEHEGKGVPVGDVEALVYMFRGQWKGLSPTSSSGSICTVSTRPCSSGKMKCLRI